MKKLLILATVLASVSAFASKYQDGIYRGLYISKQDTEVEIQFKLQNDVIQDATYRALTYKGNDWLKNPEYVAKNSGYLKVLEDIKGKNIDKVMPTLYNEEEIAKAGATVRKMKIRSALQYGLNLGPFKLKDTKKANHDCCGGKK